MEEKNSFDSLNVRIKEGTVVAILAVLRRPIVARFASAAPRWLLTSLTKLRLAGKVKVLQRTIILETAVDRLLVEGNTDEYCRSGLFQPSPNG